MLGPNVVFVPPTGSVAAGSHEGFEHGWTRCRICGGEQRADIGRKKDGRTRDRSAGFGVGLREQSCEVSGGEAVLVGVNEGVDGPTKQPADWHSPV